jgi:polysaccharide biosynthesis transport protein
LTSQPPPTPEGSAPPEAEFEFNLAEYLGMARRHWKLMVVVCLLTLAGALAHYFMTPRAYLASATLQIERRSLTPLVSPQNPYFENYWNMEFYPTQYELLKSRELAERVVKHLDLMSDPAFNPAAAAEAGRAGKATATADDDDATLGRLAEQLRGGLNVEPVRTTQLVVISFQSSSAEFAAKAVNGFAEAFIDMGVESRFATAGKVSSFLTSQIQTLKREIDDKEAKLQAFGRRSDIVTLDPASNVTLQRLQALNGNYIEAKKTRIEKEAEYHELLASPKETVADTLSGGMVGDMRTEQMRLEREYDTKLKTYKPDWPAMVDLRSQIDKGRQHLAGVVEEMVDKAQKTSYAAFQTALRQEEALQAELNKLKSEAMDQSSEAVEYNNLQTEVKTRRELLNDLLRRQSESEVTARLQDTRDSNVHIVDHALVPGIPFQPSMRKDVTSGLMVGVLFSIVLTLLVEFMDRTIKAPEEVERRLGLPTLAVIPDIADTSRSYGYLYRYGYGYGYGEPRAGRPRPARAGKGKRKSGPAAVVEGKGGDDDVQIELVPHERPRTPISEAYRSLRTALLLSSADELKVIAVTSAEAGEGKTATAANLAVVLAQLGRQVLIVDGDLRKPRLHQVFRTTNRAGLVTQLTGAAEGEPPFLRTEIPNLSFTPSGPIPPNPSELLSSERMREWLQAARQRFDTVILDTPPVLAVTDSTILGVLADGVVLTLRTGKVTREDARACRDRLRYAGVRVLGVVLNRYRATQGLGRRSRYYAAYGSYGAEPQAGSAA